MRRWWDERGDFDGERLRSPLPPVTARSGRWRLKRKMRRLAAERWLEGIGAPPTWGGRGPAFVGLCYHGVATAQAPWPSYDPYLMVSQGFLERQLHLISRWFGAVTASELWARLSRGPVSMPMALVSFDDGMRSVAEAGAPLLRSYRVPATHFLNDSVLGSGWLWHDRAAAAASALGSAREVYRCLFEVFGAKMPRLAEGAGGVAMATVGVLKCFSPPSIAAAVEALEARSGERLETQGGYMSPEQVRALVAGGDEVGGHTRSHMILPSMTAQQARAEVLENKAALEGLFGVPVRAFAYPNGDHDSRARRLMAQAGFDVAFEVEGHDGHGGRWALGRRNICDEVCVDEHGCFSGALFLGWLLGPRRWMGHPSRTSR